MKNIINYRKFESNGDIDNLVKVNLDLLKELSLDIQDLGFNVIINNNLSKLDNIHIYNMIIESNDIFTVYEVNKKTISKLKKMSDNVQKLSNLEDNCQDLINRAISNGLYLCQYYIRVQSEYPYIWCFIKFSTKSDGSTLGTEYRYYTEDDEY
jgi:hypothetical protein